MQMDDKIELHHTIAAGDNGSTLAAFLRSWSITKIWYHEKVSGKHEQHMWYVITMLSVYSTQREGARYRDREREREREERREKRLGWTRVYRCTCTCIRRAEAVGCSFLPSHMEDGLPRALYYLYWRCHSTQHLCLAIRSDGDLDPNTGVLWIA